MGATELALILKFGIPLGMKLISKGAKEQEAIDAVAATIDNLEANPLSMREVLLTADEQQTDDIINHLFGVITGIGGAGGGLLRVLFSLFGGAK